jgi:hypothetical protein
MGKKGEGGGRRENRRGAESMRECSGRRQALGRLQAVTTGQPNWPSTTKPIAVSDDYGHPSHSRT